MSTTPPDPRPSDAAYFTAIALLTIATAFTFGPVLRHEFIALDYNTYTGNPVIQQGLNAAGVRYAFTEVVASNWHPVTVLAHMTLHTLFGPEPAAHYAANLVLHWINVLLVFELARRMICALWPAALAAALFGLHPFRVESVAWTAELKDVLSTLFALLAAHAYLRFATTRRAAWYAVAAGLFVLGLLSKASIVMLPFMFLALDFWPLDRIRRGSIARVAIEKIPLFAISAAMVTITLVTFSGTTLESTAVLSLPTRLAFATIAYKDYLVTTIWPRHLSPHYPYPAVTAPAIETLVSIALLGACTLAAFVLRRRHPSLLFGWLWFLFAIAPVCGILPVGSHYRADRYTYLAHAGFFAGLAGFLAAVVRRQPVRWAAVPLVAVMTFVTIVNVHRWRDNVTLFEYAVRHTPDSALVHSGLAIGQIQQGRLDDAEHHLREALRLNPGHLPDMKRLAALLLVTDRAAESVPVYESVADAEPGNAANFVGLAAARERAGDVAGAELAADAALRLAPGDPAAVEILSRLRKNGQ